MVKKKKEDKVVEFAPKEVAEVVEQTPVDLRATMTPEEIQAFMEQEEAELNAHLNKFINAIPLPDTSSISEEDEDEEIVTLDFEDGKVIATQQIGEGVAVRDPEGNITIVEDEEAIKKYMQHTKPSLQQKYQDMITDRFVSKAVGSLVEKLNMSMTAVFENTHKGLPSSIGEHLAWEASEVINKQKKELQQSISGGVVRYDRIPEWAKSYVDEYINGALNALIDFVERD